MRRFFTSREGASPPAEAAGPGARRSRRNRPALETLEGRQLMSVGPQFRVDAVNEPATRDQIATAASSNGSSVVVWLEEAGRSSDVRAQYYNAAGAKAGPEIYVATDAAPDGEPAVAMDAHGDFVVSWTQEESNFHTDILAQKFNASSVPIDGIIKVAVGTFQQYEPSVATDAFGDFVVAYTRDTNGNNPDVFAKVYYADGQLEKVITIAASAKAESNPSVAMDTFGDFDVAYQVQNGANYDVYVARYSQGLSLLGVVTVTKGSASDDLPSIAMDSRGDAVVAYRKSSANANGDYIEATRISAAGVPSSEIFVGNFADRNSEGFFGSSFVGVGPSVAFQANGGDFAVAYAQKLQVLVVVVGPAPGNIVAHQYYLGSYWDPSISSLESGGLLMAYASFIANPDLNSHIYGQRGTYS
jgi:hypothetical protein